MGFFKNLKKNMTGDWATISVSTTPTTRGGTAVATIDINVKDDDINIDRVYAKLKCVEEIRLDNYRPKMTGSARSDKDNRPESVDVRHSDTVYDQELNVTGASQMTANSSHQLTAEFPLPPNLPPTYTGANTKFTYKVMAAIDMKGNDPNTKWVEIRVD